MYRYRQRRYSRRYPRRAAYTKRSVARIARSVVRRAEETKCFSQTLNAGSAITVSTSWQYFSATAGLTQGTSTVTRVGAKISLVAIEYFVQIVPSTANVPDNGSMCRLVCYKNKTANGSLPATAELWDNNALITGRNINYASKYTIMEDITHQMVLYSRDTSGKYSSGPQFFKCIRLTPKSVVQYGGNAGTISDLPELDFGIGVVSDDTNCCSCTVLAKIWYKDA